MNLTKISYIENFIVSHTSMLLVCLLTVKKIRNESVCAHGVYIYLGVFYKKEDSFF